MVQEPKCSNCKEPTKRKYLGKIRGKFLCRKCRVEIRKNHREKTIEDAGIKGELRKLKNKINSERGYARKSYAKKKKEDTTPPVPKGSKALRAKRRPETYLTLGEKQTLFRILIQRGMDYEEVRERIKELLKSQIKIREDLKLKEKSEEEIVQKQQELLEELWNY